MLPRNTRTPLPGRLVGSTPEAMSPARIQAVFHDRLRP
jgi:hypothetical protein